jgi:hypothetical protein
VRLWNRRFWSQSMSQRSFFDHQCWPMNLISFAFCDHPSCVTWSSNSPTLQLEPTANSNHPILEEPDHLNLMFFRWISPNFTLPFRAWKRASYLISPISQLAPPSASQAATYQCQSQTRCSWSNHWWPDYNTLGTGRTGRTGLHRGPLWSLATSPRCWKLGLIGGSMG